MHTRKPRGSGPVWVYIKNIYIYLTWSIDILFSVCPGWTVLFGEVGGVRRLPLKTLKYYSQQRIGWHLPGIFRPNHAGVLSSNPQQVTCWHQVFLQSMQLLKEMRTFLSSLETLSLFGHRSGLQLNLTTTKKSTKCEQTPLKLNTSMVLQLLWNINSKTVGHCCT